MSNPGTSGGSGATGSGFQSSLYPQPIGTFSSVGGVPTSASHSSNITTATAGMSITGNSSSLLSSGLPTMGTAPLTTAPAGTAPRKQLAAAAAAGAAAGANKSGGRAKAPYKKGVPGTGKRGGRGGGGRGGGRSGGSGGGGGEDDDGDDVGGNKGKDSDDDNDDDPEVSIEEQFILRLPPGEMCDRFREKVLAREVDESVKLRFSDPRRGTFTFEDIEFPTKLVDLPTIIEAQKTLNGKQMYKIADISQMLIVDLTPVEKVPEVKTEPSTLQVNGSMPAPKSLPPLKPSDYVWPDGLTNPLKNVRKRRFRKRVSKVAVEGVENEIERLLQEDALAEEVVYEIREQIDGMDRFDSDDGATPAPEGGHSDMDMDAEMMDMDEEEEEEDEDEDDLLAELERKIGGGENSSDEEGEEDGGTPRPHGATTKPGVGGSSASTAISSKAGSIESKAGAALGSAGGASGHPNTQAGLASSAASGLSLAAKQGDKGKAKSNQDDDEDEDEDDEEEEEEEEEEDDDDDDDDDSGSEEDDEDDGESAQMEKLLKDEIRELNGKVKDTQEKLQSAPNDILKRRFGTILDTLRKELELKTMQLEEAKGRTKSKGK
ncbi:hypothetical protein BGZ58_006650 [Dissophora ornata]|nr:hypothetical protein BGZ58_006650 [Dissophora ornata]